MNFNFLQLLQNFPLLTEIKIPHNEIEFPSTVIEFL